MPKKKLKTLVFVEGECEELPLFERFAKMMRMNLDIYPVSCNIYSFYRQLKRAGMMQNIPQLAQKIVNANSQAPRKIKAGTKFQAIYYVYDCDLQHTASRKQQSPIQMRAKANFSILKKMLAVLDDEYDLTKGKLFVNYPMMESAHDVDSFGDPTFLDRTVSLATLSKKDAYKHQVKTRIVSRRDFSKWTRDDFDQLVKLNADKALSLLGVSSKCPDADAFNAAVDYEQIRLRELWQAVNNGRLPVLNTSLLLPIDVYGDKRGDYSRIMKSRTKVALTIEISGPASREENLERLRASLGVQTNANFKICILSGGKQTATKRGYVLKVDKAGLFFDPSAINCIIGFLEVASSVDELWLVGKRGANNPSDMQVRFFDRANARAWSALCQQAQPAGSFRVCRVGTNVSGANLIAKVKFYPYL